MNNEKILDKIYFLLFFYKCLLSTNIVISNPKTTEIKIKLIILKISKMIFVNFQCIIDKYIIFINRHIESIIMINIIIKEIGLLVQQSQSQHSSSFSSSII